MTCDDSEILHGSHTGMSCPWGSLHGCVVFVLPPATSSALSWLVKGKTRYVLLTRTGAQSRKEVIFRET